jgi:hypothetical protein
MSLAFYGIGTERAFSRIDVKYFQPSEPQRLKYISSFEFGAAVPSPAPAALVVALVGLERGRRRRV